MKALIIIDAQNEFSARGQRPVPDHQNYLQAIQSRVEEARSKNIPIAWVKHYNLPNESRAFVPGTWGSDFSEGFGPLAGSSMEVLFEKNVFGAFTGSSVGAWLRSIGADTVVIMGFYSHGCVSTTSREALMNGFNVVLDPTATGTCSISHDLLGEMSAIDVNAPPCCNSTTWVLNCWPANYKKEPGGCTAGIKNPLCSHFR